MDSLLADEVKNLIIEACNLESIGVHADEIDVDAPLVGPDSPWEIDSLDAIEIVAAVEKEYKVRINNVNTAQRLLKSVRILTDFIESKINKTVTV